MVAVRVLDCGGSGSNSGIIAGMEWALEHTDGITVRAACNRYLGRLGCGQSFNTITFVTVERSYFQDRSSATQVGFWCPREKAKQPCNSGCDS